MGRQQKHLQQPPTLGVKQRKSTAQVSGAKWTFIAVSAVAAAVAAVAVAQWRLSHSGSEQQVPDLSKYGLDIDSLPLSAAAVKPCTIPGRESESLIECLLQEFYASPLSADGKTAATKSYLIDSSLGRQGTYGEITPLGVHKMMDIIGMDVLDTFYDLGSGLGRVVMQVALTSRCRRAAGVELSEARHEAAAQAARRLALVLGKSGSDKTTDEPTRTYVHLRHETQLQFSQGDASTTALNDATVVFMCSLCFPDEVMYGITRHLYEAAQPGTLVLTLKPLVACHAGLTLVGHLTLPMTWTPKFAVLVYMTSPPLPVVVQLVQQLTTPDHSGAIPINAFTADLQVAAAQHLERKQRGPFNETEAFGALEGLGIHGFTLAATCRLVRLTSLQSAGSADKEAASALGMGLSSRARSLMPASSKNAMKVPTLPAAELAHLVLARMRGDQASALDCAFLDLWPRLTQLTNGDKTEPGGLGAIFGHKSAVQRKSPDLNKIPAQLVEVMLGMIKPTLGHKDVLVHASSGVGQLVTQVQFTTDVGTVIGFEEDSERHAAAEQAQRHLSECKEGRNRGNSTAWCPPSLLIWPESIGTKLLQDGTVRYVHVKDAPSAAASHTNASVVVAIATGWSAATKWQFAMQMVMELPAGAILLSTASWPGCRRGLWDSMTVELPEEVWRRAQMRFSLLSSATTFLVTPQVNASHALFGSTEDVMNTIKDQIFRHLGETEKQKRGTWRDRAITRSQAEAVLSNLGPPFITGRQLILDRFWGMLVAGDQQKTGQVQETSGSMDSVRMKTLVSALRSSLQGEAASPFDCLAADLDALAENAGRLEPAATLRASAWATVLHHHRVVPRLGTGGTIAVIGDCRAAALMLLLPAGPEKVTCVQHEDQSSAPKTSDTHPIQSALKEFRATIPELVQKRSLDIVAANTSTDAWLSAIIDDSVSVVFVFGPGHDINAKPLPVQQVVEQLLHLLAIGGMVVSISEVNESTANAPAETLELQHAWLTGRSLLAASIRFFDVTSKRGVQSS